jgi:pimeloyl-ACP methyl ester carboxylesterase
MIVLVHGVPETAALWDPLRTHLPPDTVAVALPGFGCSRAEGFAATPDAYVGWLIGEIERIGPPVDLVGHDWGAALTYRIATRRPDLLRSWAADAAYLLHPDYVWHDLARTWQTPDAGEAFWAGYLASPVEQVAAGFEPWGLGHDDALTLAAMADETMARCALDLYRAATPNPHARWRPARTAVPGLVLDTPADPFGPEPLSLEVAHLLGAEIAHLPGLGHWWALQDPPRVAAELTAFWRSVDRPDPRRAATSEPR